MAQRHTKDKPMLASTNLPEARLRSAVVDGLIAAALRDNISAREAVIAKWRTIDVTPSGIALQNT
jgi:hypothetical protein